MRRWRVLALLLAASMAATTPARGFDLQGHRGARGLAPENTLNAFARALEIGVTTLETDLAVTKDGVLVLSHDPVLNPDIVRGDDGKWLAVPGPAINTLTLEELKRLDKVAYVRFASVYRHFRDINEFANELKDLLNPKE